MSDNQQPIVFACTGCSNVGLMANDIALNMNRDGIAEMSCASGVVGQVKPIVAQINSGRAIIVLDGCSCACTKACLRECEIEPDFSLNLEALGFEKRSEQECCFNESCVALKLTYEKLIEAGYTLPEKD